MSLLLLPQRYIFSSKSQLVWFYRYQCKSCCCYHKGTYFQANHNSRGTQYIYRKLLLLPQRYIFSSKSQQSGAKQRATSSCCCYHKGTYFQANHNHERECYAAVTVVVATTKVHIFKQITTQVLAAFPARWLLLLPQRYIFSSKSQLRGRQGEIPTRCCCYHKGTYFQANHNTTAFDALNRWVVVATTKVHIFKQITTKSMQ